MGQGRRSIRGRRADIPLWLSVQKNKEQNWDVGPFMVSASCPPDNRIHIRGGWAWQPGNSYGGIYKSTNLGDEAYVPWDYFTYGRFVSAYWYLPIVTTYPVSFDRIYAYNIGTISAGLAPAEYETAAEAEVAIERWWSDRAWVYGVALPPLILRNNGNTTDEDQFMDIDPVNRGRSYIWQREMRGTFET